MKIKDLRNELIEQFKDLKSGKITAKDAKEVTNTAGKILASAKLELEYKSFTNNINKIEFLED